MAMKQLNPHSHVKARDIRNHEEELGGRTSTEALLELLMKSDDSWAKILISTASGTTTS